MIVCLTDAPPFAILRLEYANRSIGYHTTAILSITDRRFWLIVAKNCLFVARSNMKNDILSEYYRPLLERNSFLPIPCPEKFSPAGQCWKIEPEVGGNHASGRRISCPDGRSSHDKGTLHFLFRRSDIRPGYTGKALPGAGAGNASPGTGQGMALLLLQSARLVPYAPAAISKQQSAVK